jgi:hypothetical protein
VPALCLDLIIINEGSYPAEDVLIDMHFPDGFRLINEGQLPKTPTAPDAPERPKTELERITQGFRMPDIYPMRDIRSLADVGTPTPRNVSSPAIRRTNSFDVRVHVTKINHGFAAPIDPLFIIFDTIEGARSFQIEYEIHAANLIEPAQGPLHVILDKEKVDAG